MPQHPLLPHRPPQATTEPDSSPATDPTPAGTATQPTDQTSGPPASGQRDRVTHWRYIGLLLAAAAAWLATRPILWSQWTGQAHCSAEPCSVYTEPFKTHILVAVGVVTVTLLVATKTLRWWMPLLAGLWAARTAANTTGLPMETFGLPFGRDGVLPALQTFTEVNTLQLEPGVSVTSGVHWPTVWALATLIWATAAVGVAAAWEIRAVRRELHGAPTVISTLRNVAAASPLRRWVASPDENER